MEYLEQLYQWISSKDNTFTDRYTIDDFKTNMNETDYATKMYDWISSKDDNFTSKYTVDTFIEKVKKKDDSDSPLISPEGDTESTSTTETEDVSLVSGQTPRELSFIEQQFQTDVPDAEQNVFISRGVYEVKNSKIIIRLNCEGMEDEIIYDFKKFIPKRLIGIMGSLKDVKSIKGNKEYSQLLEFIDNEEIKFVPFSDDIDTWGKAHSYLFSFLQDFKKVNEMLIEYFTFKLKNLNMSHGKNI